VSNSFLVGAPCQAFSSGGEDDAGHGLEIPTDWSCAADLVARGKARRVLVVGPPDTGKSSLCRVILRAVPCRRAWLLDGDVGQKLIGPPACVTLGRSSAGERRALRTLAFVGTTDPVRGWRRVIDGLRRLAAEAGPEVLVVNTGGLLSGPGERIKKAKIEALAPDLAIALGRHPALDALAAAHPALPWLHLAPSPRARRKNEGERRRARREAFSRYFADADTWTAPWSKLLQGISTKAVPPLPPGLLVSLRDATGQDKGLGIVLDSCPVARVTTLLTPVPEGEAVSLCRGELTLDGDFRDRRIEAGSERSAQKDECRPVDLPEG
jgi:polynucleotide 5'-hydroxyl-kinase GRC3/NOL9